MMEKFFLKICSRYRFHGQKKEITKVFEKMYSKRKSSDSPGNFGFGKAKGRNQKALSKIAHEKRSFG